MKVIPLYLPQFHQIPENDEWWGEGFTEWTNVKKAKSLFEGHYQPRIPLNKNYYDLSQVDALRWQCKIAKEHGIYGFCFYHYWFNSKLLLEKPMEMLLAHPEIDINYCISWANHDWNDGWKASSGKEKVLIGHDFDDENDLFVNLILIFSLFKTFNIVLAKFSIVMLFPKLKLIGFKNFFFVKTTKVINLTKSSI